MRYRLLLPEWAQKPGVPKALEGDGWSEDFLKEKNALGYGIYYFPNYNSVPHDAMYLHGKLVDVWNYVYVDMDIKDGKYASKESFIEKLLQFGTQPCKFVMSGNGVHAYWQISDLTREKFLTLQMRLIKTFDTDKSIWNLARIMRLEGYYNTKNPDEYKLVELLQVNNDSVDYATLAAQLLPLTADEELKIVNTLRKTDGLDQVQLEEDLDLDVLPEAFVKLMDKNEQVRFLMTSTDPDRSSRAFALTNILADKGINRFDAIAVIANHPKCVRRTDRLHYATELVDKVYKKCAKHTVPSVAERLKQFKTEPPRAGIEVRGPAYFDANTKKWRTGQVLGLVGGTGVGKSTVSLDIFKHMIQNNPDNKGIFVFFSLEMSEWDVVERWKALVGDSEELNSRLYVVSNEDKGGNPLHISLQDITWYCEDIAKVTGRHIISICIDHIGIVNPTIDISKKPDFGMLGEIEGAFGTLRTVSPRKMPQLLKEMAKRLDCFLIIQSQTSKAVSGHGDTHLGVSAAYGSSYFEQYVDYLITLCQPIRRVYYKTQHRILGWQLVKSRHLSKGDGSVAQGGVATYDPRVLAVDMDTGALRVLESWEIDDIKALSEECDAIRKKDEKKTGLEIKNSPGPTISREHLLLLRSVKR